MRLLDYGASSKERARALLREIRSLQVPLHIICHSPFQHLELIRCLSPNVISAYCK